MQTDAKSKQTCTKRTKAVGSSWWIAGPVSRRSWTCHPHTLLAWSPAKTLTCRRRRRHFVALCGTHVELKWTPAVSRTRPDSKCHLCHPCPQHTCKFYRIHRKFASYGGFRIFRGWNFLMREGKRWKRSGGAWSWSLVSLTLLIFCNYLKLLYFHTP